MNCSMLISQINRFQSQTGNVMELKKLEIAHVVERMFNFGVTSFVGRVVRL